MNELIQDGDRAVLLRCDCGRIATGYAAARCGREGRHNMRAGCPTKLIVVELVGVIPEHGYVEADLFRSRREAAS